MFEDLIKKLEHECEVALTLFRNNKTMVNPNNFLAILLNKSKSAHVKATMNTKDEKMSDIQSDTSGVITSSDDILRTFCDETDIDCDIGFNVSVGTATMGLSEYCPPENCLL